MQSYGTRVAIVSPHDVMWTGLAGVLADTSGIEVSLLRTVDDIVESTVDLVLYDTGGLHQGSDADLMRLTQLTSTSVVVVVRDLRPDLTERAAAVGADAYVSAHCNASEIRSMVLAALRGDLDADPPAVSVDGSGAADSIGLSGRERQIVVLIARGHSNQQICDALYLSINSVKTHIRSSYRKMGVRSRTQAVAWCLARGLG